MAGPVMAPIESERILPVQQLHSISEIRLRGFDQKMHVIRHEAEAQEVPALSSNDSGQPLRIGLVILVVDESPAAINAPSAYVGSPPRHFASESPAHTTQRARHVTIRPPKRSEPFRRSRQ